MEIVDKHNKGNGMLKFLVEFGKGVGFFTLGIILLPIFIIDGVVTKINSKTKHIIILGSKGSGKTTLWNLLQNKITEKEPLPTDKEPIESFKIDVGEKKVRISSTKDIGGGDDWVKDYDEIIKADGTFIFYLVDLVNLHERGKKEEIRARLRKISSIIKDKKLKDCGCNIIATNYKLYKDKGLELKYGTPASFVKKVLRLHTMDKLSMKINEFVTPVELMEDKDIENIKKQIMQIK